MSRKPQIYIKETPETIKYGLNGCMVVAIERQWEENGKTMLRVIVWDEFEHGPAGPYNVSQDDTEVRE